MTNRPSIEISKNSKDLDEVINHLEDLDMEYNYTGTAYFTDLSLVIAKIKKSFIIFGSWYIDKEHQVNEYMSIKALQNVSEIFIEYFKW